MSEDNRRQSEQSNRINVDKNKPKNKISFMQMKTNMNFNRSESLENLWQVERKELKSYVEKVQQSSLAR